MSNDNEQGSNKGRVLAGAFIIGIGILFFLRQAGISIFPYWIFTWPMILIAVGIFLGIKHQFRGGGWLVLLIIGSFFLLDDVLDMYDLRRYLVPVVLVSVGAMLILRPKKNDGWKKRGWDKWTKPEDNFSASNTGNTGFQFADTANTSNPGSTDTPERVDATAIFGSVKKSIVSKNFIGGEATSIFGGSEIDLTKADINGTITMDVTAIMGGVKIIVPSHWAIRQEVTAIFGGVEDNRQTHTIITAQNKTLVLQGTAFMGGIEISNYK